MDILDRITSRVLSLLGLELDFSFDLDDQLFQRITPTLFLGARPREADVALLADAGITHVVSCLPEAARPKVAFLAAEFQTLFLPVHDGMHEDIAAVFPAFFEVALGAPARDPDARVLVHCEVGVSRSATLATAWVMKSQGLRFFDAYSEVRSKRPQVLVNIGFASQLQHYEHTLHPERREGLASLTRYLHEVCHVPVEAEVLQSALERHDYDASNAIRAIFGDEIPRVVQGVRL